jgi:hypothetical protein
VLPFPSVGSGREKVKVLEKVKVVRGGDLKGELGMTSNRRDR